LAIGKAYRISKRVALLLPVTPEKKLGILEGYGIQSRGFSEDEGDVGHSLVREAPFTRQWQVGHGKKERVTSDYLTLDSDGSIKVLDGATTGTTRTRPSSQARAHESPAKAPPVSALQRSTVQKLPHEQSPSPQWTQENPLSLGR
jgi:hypothetical protein